jgi:alpha-1,3-rhamnosyltransferase
MTNKPLISVAIVTYNSAEFIIETLESVKAQTYPRIELIISDDCSKDNSVALCRNWLAKNSSRFERTELITVEKNTGVSANYNRVEAACAGEWVKLLDGDDLLLPSCLEDYVTYVTKHSEIVYLFSKGEAFGSTDERNKYFTEEVFDYSIYALDVKQQYERLISMNCILSSTCMYNRKKNAELGLKNDERIPLLEDWPRWVNVTKAGVKLHLLDKVEVKYRLHGNSLSSSARLSENYYRSSRQFCFLYQYPEWVKADPDKAVERVVQEEMEIYKYLMDDDERLKQLQQSKAYRLGKMLLKPFSWLKKIGRK